MKKNIVFLLALLALAAFSTRSAAQITNADETKDMIEESMATEYLIVAGSSSNYFALKKLALDLSKKTGIKYDDMARVYKDHCIVLSDSSDDEIYKGTYIFRRWEFEAISIELNVEGIFFSPSETKERPTMMIVAGMAGNKKDAEEKLKEIRRFVPTAYLKKKEVYMGCIH